MTKKLITLIACALIIGAAMGCSKKADPEMEALKAQMQAMQAELEKAKSGNASAEEIAKLETAIAQTAEQEQRAERRRGEGGRRNRDEAAASVATTQTTSPPPPPQQPQRQPLQHQQQPRLLQQGERLFSLTVLQKFPLLVRAMDMAGIQALPSPEALQSLGLMRL